MGFSLLSEDKESSGEFSDWAQSKTPCERQAIATSAPVVEAPAAAHINKLRRQNKGLISSEEAEWCWEPMLKRKFKQFDYRLDVMVRKAILRAMLEVHPSLALKACLEWYHGRKEASRSMAARERKRKRTANKMGLLYKEIVQQMGNTEKSE